MRAGGHAVLLNAEKSRGRSKCSDKAEGDLCFAHQQLSTRPKATKCEREAL